MPRAIMAASFLESTFLVACPSFRATWDARRRAYPPGGEPTATEFLGALRDHLLYLASMGQVVEVSRVLHTVERLLTDADPILADLLAEELVRPLAADVAAGDVPAALVLPHVGPRTRRLWPSTGT